MSWILWSVLGLSALGGDGKTVDVRTIPAEERIAYHNRRADRLEGENAAEIYSELLAQFKPIYSLGGDANALRYDDEYDHVQSNLDALALKGTWTQSETRVIREWLDANSETLRMFMTAVRRPRYFVPIPQDGGRLSEVWLDLDKMLHPPFGQFIMMTANDYAIRDNFTAAYAWNLRAHRMADHAYQRPGFFGYADGSRLECQASRQTLSFMARRPTHESADLLDQIRAGDDTRLPDDVGTELNMLEALDFVEAFHQWAREPDKHPKVEEMVQTAMDASLDGIIPNLVKSPFPSREAFREAVNAVTLDAEWAAYLRSFQCEEAWLARPFNLAWRDRDRFQDDMCRILREAPVLSLYGCGVPAWLGRFYWQEARMHRRALETVVALQAHHQAHGRFPASLSELRAANPSLDMTDPYSGEPLVYRLRDGSDAFTLYSVAADQIDDGGRSCDTDFHNESGDRVFWPPPEPKRWRIK